LDGKSSYTSRSAIDQDFLSALDMPLISQVIQWCNCPIWNGGSFLIGHIGWLECYHAIFGQTFVLGISAKTKTARRKNLIARLKSLYVFAHCFNFPGQLKP